MDEKFYDDGLLLWIAFLIFFLPLKIGYFHSWFWSDYLLIGGAAGSALIFQIKLFGLSLQKQLPRQVIGWIVILILAWQAQWAMGQFIIQDDLGLRLVGETNLNIKQAGVAKFQISSSIINTDFKLIRGYGPYSHPNVMGGMMLMGIIILGRQLLCMLDKHKELFSISAFFYLGILLVAGLIISFSRSAYAGLIMAIVIMAGIVYLKVKTRHLLTRKTWLIILLAISVVVISAGIRSTDNEDVAASERLAGYRWAMAMIGENSFFYGTGPGKYIETLDRYLKENQISHERWQIDYVHSVPLLIAAEWGIAGSMVLLIILIWLLRRLGKSGLFLIPIIPLLLLDHYLVTQPAPVLAMIILGALLWRTGRVPAKERSAYQA